MLMPLAKGMDEKTEALFQALGDILRDQKMQEGRWYTLSFRTQVKLEIDGETITYSIGNLTLEPEPE